MAINNYQLTVDNYLPRHLPFLLILLLHLALSLTYARQVPLGEAPDEPAHLSYAQFIARQGRLPLTLAERREAGYRSAWPPLYHFLVAGPLAAIGDTPPTRLKAVGDTPRRLIPTNGQTIAAFIHTADEALPWRGLPLAWHLGRLISVALTALSVTLTYAIAWRLTGQRALAASAAALHAFIPQVLFVGSALNDDNLLIFLSGLIFLSLLTYPPRSSPRRAFLLGALLGLATITKYNALPLWALVATWAFWRKMKQKKISNNYSLSSNFYLLSSILLFFLGSLLTAGWWFIFIWLHFNQVDTLGLLPGSLAALTAGTSDASLRQLFTTPSLSFPSLATWLEWFITLFETFWGSFGGGSTIDLPAWSYGLLAFLCLLAIIIGVGGRGAGVGSRASRSTLHATERSLPLGRSTLFLLSPLLFLPLPLLRFILTGSIVETAQGRHLFPALPAITLALVWGLSRYRLQVRDYRSQFARTTPYALRLILPLFALLLSVYSLNLIQASYPPPISLRTTTTAANLLNVKVAKSITLMGYEVGQATPGVLSLTLVWQADAVPTDDYLIELTAHGAAGEPVGGWLGHPLGGRYPTRAWDKGDTLRHTVPIPFLPGQPAGPFTITLRLLDSFNQPTPSSPLTFTTNLPAFQPSSPPILPPNHLRADDLPSAAPFTYRSTLSSFSDSPHLT
ncbi:MAG: glycosyltransferase family 39 protein [Anaerolineales bacterium]|nr:glycosyltransferase family 39 protein [Anaerolineales bacterium]